MTSRLTRRLHALEVSAPATATAWRRVIVRDDAAAFAAIASAQPGEGVIIRQIITGAQ